VVAVLAPKVPSIRRNPLTPLPLPDLPVACDKAIARNRDPTCPASAYHQPMPDAAWWSTQGHTSTPCQPRPRERLWTLTKGGKRIDAELLFHAEYGVEIQFLHEGVMAYGRRWTLRAQAVDEASAKRAELEGQGWSA